MGGGLIHKCLELGLPEASICLPCLFAPLRMGTGNVQLMFPLVTLLCVVLTHWSHVASLADHLTIDQDTLDRIVNTQLRKI